MKLNRLNMVCKRAPYIQTELLFGIVFKTLRRQYLRKTAEKRVLPKQTIKTRTRGCYVFYTIFT